jgi:hypothetical protein
MQQENMTSSKGMEHEKEISNKGGLEQSNESQIQKKDPILF